MAFKRLVVVGGLMMGLAAAGSRAEEPGQVKRPGAGEKKELLKDEHGGHGGQEKPAAEAVKKPLSGVKISPEARAELDAITAAYQKLSGLEVAGTLSADMEVGAESKKQKETFTGAFAAPNKFRHEMKGDIVVGSTGDKLYAYRPARNDYKMVEAPKGRVAASEFPNPMRSIVQMQNVGLMCALVDDAGRLLAEGMTEVSKGADVELGGQKYTALDMKGEKVDLRVLVDPGTHLVRRVGLDMRRTIEAAGRDDVKRATLTFDYTKVTPDAKPAAAAAGGGDAFAWAAPEGAKDVAAADAEEGEATALVGKEAPDFTLNGMDGKPVSMKEQRGSVVVLDFWATWCGPCKVSLPGLNKLYNELKEKGLRAYAIDLEETKEQVQPVAQKLIPDVPVLLDAKSDVAKAYGVTGIPQTVVVGKDGKVKAVVVGSGNEAKIRSAVEGAMKE